MKLDTKLLIQRAILALTTGMFLACSAQIAAQPGGFLP
jgi:hypothetical protein